MGLRQPSKTAVFFKQAQAGAEEQKKAREKLKSSQALGGSASAGTAMVAAQTQAQQGATQQVKDTTQKATSELQVNQANIPSSTAMAFSKNANVAPDKSAITTQIQAKENRQKELEALSKDMSRYKLIQTDPNNILSGYTIDPEFQKVLKAENEELEQTRKDIASLRAQIGDVDVMSTAESGDIDAVKRVTAATQNEIDAINKQIQDLDNQLLTANAEDVKKINEEKARLDAILKTYQEKLSKENLGQIAGPSTLETELATRENLLAAEGQRVAKLASIFGPGWNAKRYGGLASQIYGKDLEAIQEAAQAGLEKRAAAERAADFAEEEYQTTLETGKKGYEEKIKGAEDRLDILKKTPQELAAYSKDDLVKIFGDDAINLFNFDTTTGRVTGTKMSATRKALDDRLTKLVSEQEKANAAISKTAQVASKQMQDTYMPVDQYGNPTGSSVYYDLKNNMSKLDLTDKGKETYERLDAQFNSAVKAGDKKEAERLLNLMMILPLNGDMVKPWEFDFGFTNWSGPYIGI